MSPTRMDIALLSEKGWRKVMLGGREFRITELPTVGMLEEIENLVHARVASPHFEVRVVASALKRAHPAEAAAIGEMEIPFADLRSAAVAILHVAGFDAAAAA